MKSYIAQKNLILNKRTLVDAILIDASKTKCKYDDNGKFISNEAADSDAIYTFKRGAKYYRYKMHIDTDRAKVITNIKTTTAKVHDSQMIDELTNNNRF